VVLVAVIALRFAFVFALYRRLSSLRQTWIRRLSAEIELPGWRGRKQQRHREQARKRLDRTEILDWKEKVLVSWTGMRGIVTLAAAAAVPLTTSTGAAFPGRAVIQFIAFTVAIGTLVIQGATLPLLASSLKVDTTSDEREAEQALNDAEELIAGAKDDGPPGASPAAHFQRQRALLKQAVMDGTLDDEYAQIVMQRIDLRQAAAETAKEAG
jgi:CPA1 family monovalent cation:H+ antiporter